jgi:cation diffusion facilitator family transporter
MGGDSVTEHGHGHDHEHEGHSGHRHTHSSGTDRAALISSRDGIRAVKWSLLALGLTAAVQVAIVALSGSVALLADTVHNFGDALTAVPLWIAFRLSRLKPNRRFTYGYGRAEDLAGTGVVLLIVASAAVAAYESVDRFFHPLQVRLLWAVMAAGVAGFIGNEAVALWRLHVGRRIGSAALVADGHHARIDGLTSLGVVAGAAGVWLGFPLADPIVGVLITLAILHIVYDAAAGVLSRMLDSVDPAITDQIRSAALDTPSVRDVAEVRVRWVGHFLHAEVNVAVEGDLTVADAHAIAVAVQSHLLEHLGFLRSATIHVDPLGESGEEHHDQTQ